MKGVTDAQYFTDQTIAQGIKSGKIADCGSSMAPSVEHVLAMKPDAILLSPFQDANYGQIAKINIPIIECADYMESTPLGRAEWIKLIGELTGQRHQRRQHLCQRGDSLREVPRRRGRIEVAQTHRDYRNGGIGRVERAWRPQLHGQHARRCGAAYPWADDNSAGSLALDFSQVLNKAQNADLWLIKTFNIGTYADLKKAYALNSEFTAFKNHKVWVCNTAASPFYREFPFHPDKLLRDLASIFHPETGIKSEAGYYKPLAE